MKMVTAALNRFLEPFRKKECPSPHRLHRSALSALPAGNARILLTFLLLLCQETIVHASSGPHSSPTAAKPAALFSGAGDTIPSPQKNKRLFWVTGANIGFYTGSLLALNAAWYKDYPRSSFHVFDDSREWLQVDKTGHAWTAYTTGKYLSAMWEWAGLPRKKAVWVGGLSGAAYLTVIEFLDAHSAEWGWSWSDMAANIFGSSLFVSQELLWDEQRIQFKFSFHPKTYRDPQLEDRADNLFGKPWYERMLKDYNAQTYWFSANLHSFFKNSSLPRWLNVAVGYGADGMFGGFENRWMDKNGAEITRFDIARTRQFYLAPDIDFTKIKTRSRFLRTTFSLLNAFKCPLPALMLDSKGKWKFYPVYF